MRSNNTIIALLACILALHAVVGGTWLYDRAVSHEDATDKKIAEMDRIAMLLKAETPAKQVERIHGIIADLERVSENTPSVRDWIVKTRKDRHIDPNSEDVAILYQYADDLADQIIAGGIRTDFDNSVLLRARERAATKPAK